MKNQDSKQDLEAKIEELQAQFQINKQDMSYSPEELLQDANIIMWLIRTLNETS